MSNMNIIYKIEINLYPNPENIKKPFLWSIFSFKGNNWCNECTGWSRTPQDAWTAAYKFYCDYKQ